MIKEEVQARKLPDVLKFNNGKEVTNNEEWKARREEIKKILCEEEYGYFPKEHVPITTRILEENMNYCGGTTIFQKLELTLHMQEKDFSFPIQIAIPKQDTPCSTFLYIDFHKEFPNKNLPVEEICDNGFAVISFCYKDVSSDDANLSDGLCQFFKYKDEKRNFGKILVWAWAAMHVMDYIQANEKMDSNNVTIVGLSRLGKTALLTGAFDDRFKYTISNNSGQSGAAISRGKKGERIKDICTRFPYWFCSNYAKYSEKEELQPFDQHYLMTLVAPRNLYVASASEDAWADPKSEFLCCIATNPVYELLEKKGVIYEDKCPLPGQKLHEGNIGYHLRKGTHYLSRYDWNRFMEYIKLHK